MAVLLFVVIINALLGLLVFARNTKSPVSILFLVLVINICLWSISSYLTDTAGSEIVRLFFAKMAFVFPVVFTGCLALFSRIFPVRLDVKRLSLILIVLITEFGVFASASSLVVSSIKVDIGSTEIVPGSFYYGYIAIELLLLGLATWGYLRARRLADRVQSMQSKYIAAGLLVSFFWALLFSVLLPIFVTSGVTAKAGPIGTIFFVGATAYAIIRHRLFDIRLVVARSLTYAFSILFIGLVYGLVAFNITRVVTLNGAPISHNQEIFYIALAVVMAFTFARIKNFFDRVTSRVFYRDAYEPQTLIDSLNEVLVGNIELEKLLTQSAQVIGTTFKADFCLFGITATGNGTKRITGNIHKSFKSEDIVQIQSLVPKFHQKVIIADELEDHDKALQKLMRNNDIAALARLTDASNKEVEGLGYIMLGPKRSGNLYSSKDTKMLGIIADELVIAIQNALRFEEIQNFNITLQEKIDTATRKLRQTNIKLKALDESKDEFISMASHQLRTPLTSVKGYISMVLEGDAGKVSKTQRELLDQSYISAQRMVYLIADLLNVSRLKTGKFEIEPVPTNLAEVVSGELASLVETAKSRGLTLDFKKPKDFPTLMLDETKIRQVVMNFVDNAIYYTRRDGHITVELADTRGAVELTVVDNGIGVPKAEQHHLFNKFYRAGNARQSRPDGTGLGLFMAKKVVIAHGGAIIFKSVEGQGSTFGFSFQKEALLPQNYKGPISHLTRTRQ